MASSAGQKWLIGCGIGCVALVLLAVIAGTGACYMFKDFAEDFQEVQASHSALIAEFGDPDEFIPATHGSMTPERIETFLAVRAGLEESRAKMHALFEKFPPDEGSGFMMFFKVAGGFAGMIGDIVDFVDARNNLLLDQRMGDGEYFYIYTVVYHSWLEHDLADGPMHDGQRIFDGADSTFGVNESYRNYREFMLAVLRNQLDALPESADEAWRTRLLEEIDTTDRDRRHVVWRGDLPPALEASLAPYRAELEAAYDAETNCFELPSSQTQTQKGFQFSLD